MALPVYRGFKLIKELDHLAQRAKRIPDGFCIDEEHEIFYHQDDTIDNILGVKRDVKAVTGNDAADLVFGIGAVCSALYRR